MFEKVDVEIDCGVEHSEKMGELSCTLNPGRPDQFLLAPSTLLKLIDVRDPTNAVADDEDCK